MVEQAPCVSLSANKPANVCAVMRSTPTPIKSQHVCVSPLPLEHLSSELLRYWDFGTVRASVQDEKAWCHHCTTTQLVLDHHSTVLRAFLLASLVDHGCSKPSTAVWRFSRRRLENVGKRETGGYVQCTLKKFRILGFIGPIGFISAHFALAILSVLGGFFPYAHLTRIFTKGICRALS